MNSYVLTIIFAAGKSSRMGNKYSLNKSILPLYSYCRRKMIDEIISQCPIQETKIVVKHQASKIIEKIPKSIEHLHQSKFNGIAGALIEFNEKIKESPLDYILLVLGDTPLIRKPTYIKMINAAEKGYDLVLLCHKLLKKNHFYGYIDNIKSIRKIIDYSEWKDYNELRKEKLEYCNSGPMVIKKDCLCKYIQFLKPHQIKRTINGKHIIIEEFLYTDLVELMAKDNCKISYVIIPETEALGINTPEDLKKVQEILKEKTHW